MFEPSEVTLEDQILGAWEALTAHGRAECPVCHGELETSGCKTCGSAARLTLAQLRRKLGRIGSPEPPMQGVPW